MQDASGAAVLHREIACAPWILRARFQDAMDPRDATHRIQANFRIDLHPRISPNDFHRLASPSSSTDSLRRPAGRRLRWYPANGRAALGCRVSGAHGRNAHGPCWMHMRPPQMLIASLDAYHASIDAPRTHRMRTHLAMRMRVHPWRMDSRPRQVLRITKQNMNLPPDWMRIHPWVRGCVCVWRGCMLLCFWRG